ncbi:rRNA maturation RNase YbeY [Kaarinaea lacus]
MNTAIEIDYQVEPEFTIAAYIPDEQNVNSWIKSVLAMVGYEKPAQVSVCVVDRQEITALNSQFRKKNQATNVLSFPYEALPGVDVPLLGDIVICADVVNEESREQGKTAEQHWAHMIVHGVLHLLGHDHIDDADAQLMEALEIKILAQLGYSNPYGELDIS